jgi:hypothetical protein
MALVSSYTEAVIRGVTGPVVGQPGDIHATAQNAIGARALDQFDNEYVYLKGVANTVEGMAVTYEEDGTTTLLAANAKGAVAWATGAIVAAKFGWFARFGTTLLARVVTATADNSLLGRETTDGEIGDGRAAGDQIYGVIARAANASGATVLQKIQTNCYPFVDDVYGA